jgi:ABC-type dipeptide/oligopeptide/nickel transport system ATPase component
MAMICGARLVLTDEPTGAIDVRSTIVIVLFISTIEVSIGAVHVPMTPTSVRIVITTMQMVVTHAQIILMTMGIVLSMTIVTDLMQSSTQPTRTSDYTLV